MSGTGFNQKNQASVVKYNAYQNSTEYFEKLDSKFEDLLADKEDGVEQKIKYLEEKFGISRKLNDFHSCF